MFTAAQLITLALTAGALIVGIVVWGIRLEGTVRYSNQVWRADLAALKNQHTSEMANLQQQRASDLASMQQLRAADLAVMQAQRTADRELYGERFNRVDHSMQEVHKKLDDLLNLEGNRRKV